MSSDDDRPRLAPPNRARLIDDVCRILEESILSGKMRPGERLVEAWIAEQLQVSRTTVREALLMLDRQGLVESEPRRGTFVKRLSQQESFELGVARALIEGFAVRIGFANITEAMLTEMERYIDEMRVCRIPEDVPQLVRIDLALHQMLAESCRSPHIIELWSSLSGQVRAQYLTTLENDHVDTTYIVAFHQNLIAALRSGDAAIAQRAVISHYVDLPEDDQLNTMTRTFDILASGFVARTAQLDSDTHSETNEGAV